MRIEVRGRGIEPTPALRDYVERRLRFALGRFGGRVDGVTARLADANGPRGGVDKQCSLQARLASSGSLRLEERDIDLYVAIDRATERLGRSVARELARRREPRASSSLLRHGA